MFLSGFVFLDKISMFYNGGREVWKKSEIEQFIKVKYYNFEPKQIKILSNNEVGFYSMILKKEIIVSNLRDYSMIPNYKLYE